MLCIIIKSKTTAKDSNMSTRWCRRRKRRLWRRQQRRPTIKSNIEHKKYIYKCNSCRCNGAVFLLHSRFRGSVECKNLCFCTHFSYLQSARVQWIKQFVSVVHFFSSLLVFRVCVANQRHISHCSQSANSVRVFAISLNWMFRLYAKDRTITNLVRERESKSVAKKKQFHSDWINNGEKLRHKPKTRWKRMHMT